MTIDHEREILKKRLRSKKHRDAFVSAYVDKTIPFQVRAMRLAEERNWTQEELASRAGMKQERISTCENPNYGRFSLQTLKQLAFAFDVALIVRFAPFSELVDWEINISPESIEVPNFDQEKDYFEVENNSEYEPNTELLKACYSEGASHQPHTQSKTVVYLSERRSEIEKKMSLPPLKKNMALKKNLEISNEAIVC